MKIKKLFSILSVFCFLTFVMQGCETPDEPVSHTHEFTYTVTSQPTCTQKGTKSGVCACGYSKEVEIPATGHNYVDGICKVCNLPDPDHAHIYEYSTVTVATCMANGTDKGVCKICGASTFRSTEKTAHSFQNGKCGVCGLPDPDHKHSFAYTLTEPATCLSQGMETGVCVCGETSIRTIEKLPHVYVDGVCTECHSSDPDHQHTYTYALTKQPTCTSDGYETGTCVCGEKDIRIVEKNRTQLC